MRHRIVLLALMLICGMGIGLVSFVPMRVQAIGEITPTPAPTRIPAPSTEVIDVGRALTDAFGNIQSGDIAGAIDLLTAAIQTEPDNAEAYMLRSLAHSGNSDFASAIDDLSQAIDLIPQTYHSNRAIVFPLTEWLLYTLRGDLYAGTGDNALALADYNTAINLSPAANNNLAFQSRAALNYTLGETAAGDVDDAIARAMESMQSGNATAAIDLFTKAIESGQQTPAVAVAHYNLAILNDIQGNSATAILEYTEALRVNPDLHVAHLARGTKFRESGDLAAAGADFYNRIMKRGNDFVDETLAFGSGLEVAMDYQRVVRITFDGNIGQTVTLSAREVVAGQTDPLIALLDPSGNPIAGDDDSGGNLDSLIADFSLPVTGTYTLLVSHAEGGYASGFEGVIQVAIENCSSSGTCA